MSTSDKLNDVFMGVLSAALVAIGGKTMINIVTAEHPLEKPAYALPMPSAGGASGAAEAKFDPNTVLALLPKAKADAGADTFKKCATCHNDAKGAGKKVGPDLWDVIGRPIGKEPGMDYSDAMKTKGGNWTWPAIATYLHAPADAVPGNKMAFAGVDDNADLADLLAFLNAHADKPLPLPTVAAAAPASAAPAGAAPAAAPAPAGAAPAAAPAPAAPGAAPAAPAAPGKG